MRTLCVAWILVISLMGLGYAFNQTGSFELFQSDTAHRIGSRSESGQPRLIPGYRDRVESYLDGATADEEAS